ncbi:MAG: hypothetical protein PPFGHCPK_01355 (plasmid) [Spiroplasma endosymbiont of Drosophila atripex]|nr:MAG: hypothetical protein PPFGHCPK_01355 [Spiroplasma endosymbiont of Drosophila atripex]
MFKKIKSLFCKNKKVNKSISCRSCNVSYPNKCPSCSLKKEGNENQFKN